MMKVSLILGTRPEIIKMSPLVRACQAAGIESTIIHTGQHYSWNMDRSFFEDLKLPPADYNLEVGSQNNLLQTSLIMQRLAPVLEKVVPDAVLVLGDTNTVLAGSLAANKMGIRLGHVEAGLRSYDRRMPEEFNRVISDHLADWLFCPTSKSMTIVKKEGIPDSRLFMTGNTIVDAVQQNLELARRQADPFSLLEIERGRYILATAHRQEYVDHPDSLRGVIDGLTAVADKTGLPVVFPMHPRTRKMVGAFGISLPSSLRVIEPTGFFDFLRMEENAALILTDSGGVQEEACILRVPCVTLRDNTERPETVEVGANRLAGTNPCSILAAAKEMIDVPRNWTNPFGDGHAAQRMIDIIRHV
jgi:UDP-N-acetylglucosamine 2-epimerase (non-hydrolysing)